MVAAKTLTRPRLCWVQGKYLDGTGNAYGYTVHSRMLEKYLPEEIQFDDEAPDALLIIAPEFFHKRIPGKVNWIFTMFEGTTIPEDYATNIQKADYLIAPSKWVKDLLGNYFSPEKVFVVPHGVESIFSFKRRRFPTDRPFRFLWVGAPNPRKGWEETIHAWKLGGFYNDPRFELYVKTTRKGKFEKKGNVILDSRDLTLQELVRLYHKSHCFLFPSRGEGFGLTLAEAMATGLPCIGTSYSGHADFFDDRYGYVVGHKIGEAKIVRGDGIDRTTQCAYPHVDELIMRMVDVYKDYREGLRKGERASLHIRRDFTWYNTARVMASLLNQYGGGNGTGGSAC